MKKVILLFAVILVAIFATQPLSARNPNLTYYVDKTVDGVELLVANNNGQGGYQKTVCKITNNSGYKVDVTVEIKGKEVNSNGTVSANAQTIVAIRYVLTPGQEVYPLEIEKSYADVEVVKFIVQKK